MLKVKKTSRNYLIILLSVILLSIIVNVEIDKKNKKNEKKVKTMNRTIQKYSDFKKKFNYGDMIDVFNNDNNFSLLKIYENNDNKEVINVDAQYKGSIDLLESKLYEKSKKGNFNGIDSITIVNIGNNNNIEAMISMKFIKNK